jgi:hypothetical protein
MGGHQIDPRVDDYIESLPAWQATICRRVREVAHAADPEVVETIKRSRQPYFTLDGNICALLAAKDHVNVFIYDPIAPDSAGIINQVAATSLRAPSRSGKERRSTGVRW